MKRCCCIFYIRVLFYSKVDIFIWWKGERCCVCIDLHCSHYFNELYLLSVISGIVSTSTTCTTSRLGSSCSMATFLDQLTFISIVLLVTVRISGFLCVLAIGLGLSWISWFLCKFVCKKPKEDVKRCSIDSNISSQCSSEDLDFVPREYLTTSQQVGSLLICIHGMRLLI